MTGRKGTMRMRGVKNRGNVNAKKQNTSGKDAALFMRHTVLDIAYTRRTEARRPVWVPV